MAHTETSTSGPAEVVPVPAGGLPDLVNRLTQELASMQRALAAAQQKLGSTSRSLESRTQELTEARAALALLLATLDSTTDGILALGYFGRAMHYNTRFIEMWRIPADMLASLNESALLTLQLAQVRHPQRFLAEAEMRKARPDEEHFNTVEMTDGRVLECHVVPQRVRGKRVGCVTSFHDVTERERLGRLVSVLEAELPLQVAEAKASMF
ncbi:MAG: PAS domain-containing protein [Pseudomonadota bacterium]